MARHELDELPKDLTLALWRLRGENPHIENCFAAEPDSETRGMARAVVLLASQLDNAERYIAHLARQGN